MTFTGNTISVSGKGLAWVNEISIGRYEYNYTAEYRFLCLCRKYILAVIRETKKKRPAKKKEHKQVIKNIRNVTQEWAIVVACHHIMNMHDGN